MLIGAVIGIVMLLLLRPSVREERELTERLFAQPADASPRGFFSILWESFRHKNFLLFIALFLCFNTLSMTAISSLPYFLEFVLEVPIAKANSTKTMLIMIEFIGVFASIPLWSLLAKKRSMKSTAVLSNLLIVVCLVPFFFVRSVASCFVVFFFLGLGVGGFWIAILPLLSDTVDEITVSLGRHEEGVYFGVKTFFMRLSLIVQAFIYWAVRGLSGFTPETMQGNTITDAMRFGIRFEIGGATAILLLVATLLFHAKYDLTPVRITEIRGRIEAMKPSEPGEPR
jgi:Na+/melibiose symporter-like transporter